MHLYPKLFLFFVLSLFAATQALAKESHDKSPVVFQDMLQDGSPGPKMTLLPTGVFRMGDLQGVGQSYELPIHEVVIDKSIGISIYPVTFDDYDKFTKATGKALVDDFGWGREARPVINVNIDDAVRYTEWLSKQTGHKYRVPTEAEWEYAVRAESSTVYPWGNEIGIDNASCKGCGSSPEKITMPVGSYPPNRWGLYDMLGNIWEMTADCWNYDYIDAPTDGSAWRNGDCTRLVLRGGSWGDHPRDLRSSTRLRSYAKTRTIIIGFRVVRE